MGMNIKSDKSNVLAVVSILFFALAFIVAWKLPTTRILIRTALVLFAVFLISSIVIGVKFKGKFKKILTALIIADVIVFIYLLLNGFNYSFIGGSDIDILLTALIISVLVAAFVTFRILWNNCRAMGRIGYFLLFLFITFAFSFNLIGNLNYALDFSEPIEECAVIEKKDIDYNSKGPDSYEFELTVDGERFFLEVSSDEYDRYLEWDLYYFKKYKGAFNKPFYLSET